MEEIVEFKGRLDRVVFEKDDYKILALKINKRDYPNIVLNQKYGTVSVIGNIYCELSYSKEYNVTSTIKNDNKYGTSYQVISFSEVVDETQEGIYNFLCEILTVNQAKEVFRECPNIVEELRKDSSYKPDLTKMKGIGDKTYDLIKNKILDNYVYASLIKEFSGAISLTVIKELYDKYKNVDRVRKEIDTDPYKCMYSLSGIGFKKADSIIKEMYEKGHDFGYDPTRSIQRCLAYIEYCIRENEQNGNTCTDIIECKNSCVEKVFECSDNFLEAITSERFHLDKNTKTISLKRTFDTEEYIANTLKELLNVEREELKYNIEDYREYDGIQFTDEQLNTLPMIAKNGISILAGFAGSGKSQVTNIVIRMLQENGIYPTLVSPTAKAAKVMSSYTNREAMTIHRCLGCHGDGMEWEYNEHNKLSTKFVIIDEFSMVDIYLFKRLLQAIDVNKTRILLIGDPAQLPSVSCGNILYDLMNTSEFPKNTLTKIFRYKDGGLMKVASDIREAKQYLGDISNKYTQFGSNQDYIFVESSVVAEENMVDVINLYKKLLESQKVEDVQVITAYKSGSTGVDRLNGYLQKVANENARNEDSVCLKTGETKFYLNDFVIQRVNNYKSRVYEETDVDPFSNDLDCFGFCDHEDCEEVLIANGETGKIIAIDEDFAVIKFDEETVIYNVSEMSTVKLAYAITIHSSQGSSIPYVIAYTPRSQQFMLSSNLLYVAMSRTKVRCFHIGDKKTIDTSVKKRDNLKRKTLLQDLLKSN